MNDRTTAAPPNADPPGTGLDLPDEFGDDHEPAILGAASTLQLQREDRSRRARRKAAAAEATAHGERMASLPFEPTGIVHVFEPGGSSQVSLREYVRSLWRRRAFLVELAKADLRGTRSNTALGRLWGVLDPLFQAAVYYFLFRVIGGSSGRPIDFLPVLVAGVFLLALTMNAINDGGRSIKRSKGLLLNSTFPRAMLPLVTQYRGLLSFIPSMGVIAFFYVTFGHGPGPELLVLPLLFAIQMVLNVGIALLVSTVVVLVRDASNLLTYVTRILFFATPVIYPAERLPEAAYDILRWQPLFALFEAYQRVFMGEMPSASLILQSVAWAGIFLGAGTRIFRKREHEFAMHL